MEKENPKPNTVGTGSEKEKIFVAEKPKEKPALSPEMLLAIQEAVAASVSTIVKQLMPVTPIAASASVPLAMTQPAPQVPQQAGYVSKLKGIEVELGQDLRHVGAERIRNWFAGVEQRWKQQYNKRQIAGGAVDMSWTRG